jgi:hypothetical protein
VRRFIAIVLIISVGLAVAGTYVIRPQTNIVQGSCTPTDLRDIQTAITGQTEALSAQDFQRARSYSSASFRLSVTEQQFVTIISSGYPFLLESPSITFDTCDEAGPGQIDVFASFDVNGQTNRLRYVMVIEDGTWLISAATNANPRTLST